MDRACENCRFCIYAHSMRGKEEPYCERYSKWIGNALLCSEWEMVSVPKQQTNADRIRSMTDEELAEFFTQYYYDGPKFYCPVQPVIGEGECAMRSDCRQCWLDWLKQEAAE